MLNLASVAASREEPRDGLQATWNGLAPIDFIAAFARQETLSTIPPVPAREGRSPACNFSHPVGRQRGDMFIRDRDSEFKDFYMHEAPSLRRLAIMLTGDSERGSDLAQDALLKMYTGWSRIRNEDPSPYARRVLVNLCRSAHRRRMLELRKAPAPLLDIIDREGRVEEALRVAAALSVLSPIQRAVVLLRFYEDMTEQNISNALERPLNTVKSDLRRALEKLRPVLDDNVKESR